MVRNIVPGSKPNRLRSLVFRCLVLLLVSTVYAPLPNAHTDISASEAHDMILAGGDLIVLDVREYSEFCGSTSHIADAACLPWNSDVLQARFSLLPVDHEIIVVCAFGGRSHQAADFLESQGYTSVYDMLGGMSAWAWETESCGSEPLVRLGSTAPDTEIDWTPTTGAQDYDLLRGAVEELTEDASFVDLGLTDCLADDTPFTYHRDSGLPPSGTCHFYLARQKDGTWGQSSQGRERVADPPDCGLP